MKIFPLVPVPCKVALSPVFDLKLSKVEFGQVKRFYRQLVRDLMHQEL
jgi:hypothetical protein